MGPSFLNDQRAVSNAVATAIASAISEGNTGRMGTTAREYSGTGRELTGHDQNGCSLRLTVGG
jgi:hypothetical protein